MMLFLAAGKENLVAGGAELQAQLRKLEVLHSKGEQYTGASSPSCCRSSITAFQLLLPGQSTSTACK